MTAQDEIGYLDGRQPIEAAKRKGEENSLSRNGRHCRRSATMPFWPVKPFGCSPSHENHQANSGLPDCRVAEIAGFEAQFFC